MQSFHFQCKHSEELFHIVLILPATWCEGGLMPFFFHFGYGKVLIALSQLTPGRFNRSEQIHAEHTNQFDFYVSVLVTTWRNPHVSLKKPQKAPIDFYGDQTDQMVMRQNKDRAISTEMSGLHPLCCKWALR